jgi:hypothetical protein
MCKVDETPRGYSQVAVLQSSDRSFLQFRGFGYLHCRVLCDLQHGIECLERELDDLDQHDKDEDPRRLHSRKNDQDKSDQDPGASLYPDDIRRNRPEVLRELKEKLMEYGKIDDLAIPTAACAKCWKIPCCCRRKK